MGMDVNDEVDHTKPIEVDTRLTKALESSELEARDLLFKASNIIRSPLCKSVGVAALFFYNAGPNTFEYKSVLSVDYVPEALAQAGAKEIVRAIMQSYGVTPPKDRADNAN